MKKVVEDKAPESRYATQDHTDKMKDIHIHDVSPLRQEIVRSILFYAAIKRFRIFSHGVKQAYLQSEDELNLETQLRPKPKNLESFDRKEGLIVKLCKLFDVNGDYGDYWSVPFDLGLKEYLCMQPTDVNPSLQYTIFSQRGADEDRPQRVLGNYVDDSSLTGNEKFQQLTLKTLKEFDSRERICDKFDSCRCTVSSNDQNALSLLNQLTPLRLSHFPKEMEALSSVELLDLLFYEPFKLILMLRVLFKLQMDWF